MTAMTETKLSFLMRDGGVTATFRPGLSPEQYAELHRLVETMHGQADLREALQIAAANKPVVFDSTGLLALDFQGTEVMVFALNGDDRVAHGLVKAVLGYKRIGGSRHVRN